MKLKEVKIDTLIPDDLNANKGTEYGAHLIEKSLTELGFGRSILIDKNNRIIAGNKTIEGAGAIGLENVVVVETTGDTIVAVKRTDIDLDSPQGRSLALADNATAQANLEWDNVAIQEIQEKWEITPSDWGIEINDYADKNKELDVSGISDEMTMSFKFSEKEYMFVKTQLNLINETPEDALLKLLKFEKGNGEV